MTPGTVAVLGSINADRVLGVPRFPQAGETLLATRHERHLGGKGANQAIAAARAGAATRLIGAVGDDAEGHVLLRALAGEGVDCSAVHVLPNQATGTAYILVDAGGENQIVVSSGANALAEASATVDAAVLLAQLETPLAATRAFFERRKEGACAILNAAPFNTKAAALFALADIVVVNAVELAGYAGATAAPTDRTAAIALANRLLPSCAGLVIVTLGEQGSVTVGQDGARHCGGPPARVIDTTGAGDCFCGYLAAGIAAGQGIEASVTLAHRAAAIAVSRHGASTAIPFAAELG